MVRYKLSIITPTHDPKYINEAYESLSVQLYDNWEWIVVTNNGAEVSFNDKRVKVIKYDGINTNIGALKRFACSKASGDIIVELDHDDILTPLALEKIAAAFQDEDICFAYSNSANFNQDGSDTVPYNAAHGWKYRDFEYMGKTYNEAIAFEPSPSMMSLIYYCPNHVRAWRTKDYWEIGGHDESMEVIDDHDLVCRFYLHGNFKHIDECLYLYRIHGKNSWIIKNKKVQQMTREVQDKYLVKMIEKNSQTKIDLGGAFSSPEGYTSVDIEGAEINCDLSKTIPYPDSSVDVVRAYDFIEHIEDKIYMMNEIYRVLKHGGWLLSYTPSTDGRGAFQDPTHVSYWNENSFWYYTDKKYSKYCHDKIKCRFQAVRLRTETNIPNIPYIRADLMAIKTDARICGMVKI